MIKVNRLKKKIITSRLKRKIFAEWTQINLSDPNLIQYFTDSMTYNYPVQINYDGSGWRDIQPYGWNTSKDGNVLVMCYKDTGEVRSYRLDKILDMYIDMGTSGFAVDNNEQMNEDNQVEIYENIMNDQQDNVVIDMPLLDEQQEQQSQPGIYEEELSILDNNTPLDSDTSSQPDDT